MQPVDLHRQRFRLQPVAVAGNAGRRGHVFLDFLAHAGALGLLVAALEIADHAFEWLGGLVGAQAIVIDEVDRRLAGAVEHGVLHLLAEVFPGRAGRRAVMLGHRLQRLQVVGRGGLAPRHDGAIAQRQRHVRDDEVRIDLCSVPSPSQTGQAPNGLLNENSRGSISAMVKPETGQANFSEKVRRRGVPSSAFSSANSTKRNAVGELQRRLEALGQRGPRSRARRQCGQPPPRYRA